MSKVNSDISASRNTAQELLVAIRYCIYWACHIALLLLTILSFITLSYAFFNAYATLEIDSLSFQAIHSLVSALVEDSAAIGAFGIVIAGLTFISRHEANDTQLRTYLLHKERWDYEEEKVRDDFNQHRASKSNLDISDKLSTGFIRNN